MKIDLMQHIFDMRGRPVMTERISASGDPTIRSDGRPVLEPQTLRNLIIEAVLMVIPGEDLPVEVKRRSYALANKLYEATEFDFAGDELELAKARVERCYGPLVMGRVVEILEVKPAGSDRKDA